MKITAYGNIKPANSTKRRESVASSGVFADFLNAAQAGSQPISEASDVSSTANIGNLLALQEISEEEKRREKLVKKGTNMLSALENLRHQLLIGEIPESILNELSTSLTAQREQTNDPQLIELIDEIELRVAVELAKLEMNFARNSEF